MLIVKPCDRSPGPKPPQLYDHDKIRARPVSTHQPEHSALEHHMLHEGHRPPVACSDNEKPSWLPLSRQDLSFTGLHNELTPTKKKIHSDCNEALIQASEHLPA